MINKLVNKWKNFKNVIRETRVMRLWQNKNYDKMTKVLSKPQYYSSIKINEFPFIFFLINEKDHHAISTLLKNIKYKDEIINDQTNPMAMTPIYYAFMQGDDKTVEILKQNGGDIKKLNSSFQNILHLTAIYKQQQIFKKAMSLGIDINLKDQFGNTPFHYAARTGSVQLIGLMIAAKAKKIQNKLHEYPIHMSIQSGNYEAFNLLKNDCLLNYPKYHPLHSAARSTNCQIINDILKLKPSSLNIKDQKGLTPLHHATMYNVVQNRIQDFTTCKYLLDQPGILINQKDQYGNTPLHLALMGDNLELCRLLIQRGASLDIINKDNLSPADYGISGKNKEIHSLLKFNISKSMKVQQWANEKY